MHYFNQAAGGLMPDRVLQAVTDYMQREQALGSYVAAQQAQPQLQQLYAQLAALLHCQPADIALTTGNTHGWCAVVGALPLQAGDRVLVTPGEWGGNYAMLLQLQARTGCVVETMPCTADGHIDLEALEAGLDARVQLIALTWVPANGSTVYDAQALGQLCARHGIPYIIDAAQALGHIPVDVQALQCDVLTAPGRKWLCGPRGTGLVYLKPGFAARLQPMTVDHVSCPITPTGPVLRQGARMLEQSESSVALKLGLLAALDTAQAEGWAQRFTAIAERARQLRSALADVPGLRLHSLAAAPADCGIVPFTLQGHTPAQVQQALLQCHIQVAASGMGFTPLDMQARDLSAVVRASVSAHTTDADIQALVQALQTLSAAPAR
ncbi:aminotransferase class V-fold PLP-dependent enzyme [Comamonas aquatica]|jgi:selenocysteine lyase/cysteine desulfurase|uniref:Pyridoxal-phosphate-dependent protein EgtE n=1 Tax=Comamonas aquatica TaxID=225991 RepID=A0AA35GJ90_9BURK|nr:aminotransferase class V-fold PLP-dependent enzyme [Comamonas aquatica]CAB5694890.1 Pyridoxal-phosphate-dependent protein EgtE [Comamonas aquatica]CAC9689905.1 Pyridoxal-phosphate-dependent protein EgtE [Comamonas aquatica]